SAKRLEDPDRPADVDLAEHLCWARVGSAVPGLPHGPGDHCPVEPSGTSACWLTRQVSAAVPPEALRDEIRGARSVGHVREPGGDRLADLLEFNDFLRPTAVLILFGLKGAAACPLMGRRPR